MMKVYLKKELETHSVAVHIKGDRACFSIPMSGYNHFSYPIPTGSAAKGIFDNIYAHPHNRYDADGNLLYQQNFKWVIDKIFILKPIVYFSHGSTGRKHPQKEDRHIQAYTILNDVEYVIIGHPEIINNHSGTDAIKHIKWNLLEFLKPLIYNVKLYDCCTYYSQE